MNAKCACEQNIPEPCTIVGTKLLCELNSDERKKYNGEKIMNEKNCWVCEDEENEIYDSGMCFDCCTAVEDLVDEGLLPFDATPQQVHDFFAAEAEAAEAERREA